MENLPKEQWAQVVEETGKRKPGPSFIIPHFDLEANLEL